METVQASPRDSNSFTILEYVDLGLHNTKKYFPLEETTIRFENNANYFIESELLFEPPQYDKKILHHIYNNNNTILEKIKANKQLSNIEQKDFKLFPKTYLICALNGFELAINKLKEAKPYLKNLSDKTSYIQYKDSLRILRKLKYQ